MKLNKRKLVALLSTVLITSGSFIPVYANDKFILRKGTMRPPYARPHEDPDAALINQLEYFEAMKKSGSWNNLGRPVVPPSLGDSGTGSNGYIYKGGLDFSWYSGTGKDKISSQTESYRKTVEKILANPKYTDGVSIDADLVLAIIMTESGGNKDAGKGKKYGQGLMQIEYGPHRNSFHWAGNKLTGTSWTDADFYVPEKNIIYGVRLLVALHKKYGNDYNKIIQGYNFSSYSIDALVRAFGDDWMNHRREVGQYNGTGRASYGNPVYVEKVLSYYRPSK